MSISAVSSVSTAVAATSVPVVSTTESATQLQSTLNELTQEMATTSNAATLAKIEQEVLQAEQDLRQIARQSQPQQASAPETAPAGNTAPEGTGSVLNAQA